MSLDPQSQREDALRAEKQKFHDAWWEAERQLVLLRTERDQLLAAIRADTAYIQELKAEIASAGEPSSAEIEGAARDAIAYVRRWYDESIFPPQPEKPHTLRSTTVKRPEWPD